MANVQLNARQADEAQVVEIEEGSAEQNEQLEQSVEEIAVVEAEAVKNGAKTPGKKTPRKTPAKTPGKRNGGQAGAAGAAVVPGPSRRLDMQAQDLNSRKRKTEVETRGNE